MSSQAGPKLVVEPNLLDHKPESQAQVRPIRKSACLARVTIKSKNLARVQPSTQSKLRVLMDCASPSPTLPSLVHILLGLGSVFGPVDCIQA